MTKLTASADTAALADVRRRAAEPDHLRRAVAQRVGVPVDTALPVLLAALDEALDERAEADRLPDGVVTVDEIALAELRADAELGRTERERDLINRAISTGKIPPSSRASWQVLLATDPRSAQAALAKIKPNTVPVAPVGHGDDEERDLLDRVFGT